MVQVKQRWVVVVACWAAGGAGAVWAVERVQPADAQLDCAGIATEREAMKKLIDAGSTERTLGTAAAGGAANVGAQVATAQAAGGLFGAFGGLATRLAGAVAQTTVESKMAPDAAAQAKATQAQARDTFLTQLAQAKNCQAGGSGTALSPEAFQQVAGLATAPVVPLSAEAVASAVPNDLTPLSTDGLVEGKIDLKGKRVHLTEYRVLFDVGGEVSGSTRAGYLFGTDYGATRVTVTYKVPNPDVAAFQAITDRAFADFKARMAAAGVDMVYDPPEGGGVYNATEVASQPGAPVFLKNNQGYGQRQMLVMAPTGMKLVSRGLAGIGAGDIGKRIDWSKKGWDGLSVTQTVNIAALESSGSGSAILRRSSSAEASSQLTVGNPPGEFAVQAHVGGGLVKFNRSVEVPGVFAQFRTVKDYDSNQDPTMRALGVMQNMMGQAANRSRRVDKEVDLDGPAMARLSLQGLATANQALATVIGQGSR